MVLGLLKLLPQEFDLDQVKSFYPTLYEESMNTVLFQETEKYTHLLKKIKLDLNNLFKAIQGLIVLNDYLEGILDALTKKVVPVAWSDTFLSLKPLLSWYDDLNKRCEFFNNWILNGTPVIYWFSGFSFPQAFITGTMQNYARKKKIEIDLVSFEFLFLDEAIDRANLEKPELGVYIEGLFIEGAQWNYERKIIENPKPKELFSKLPVIWLKPTERQEFKEEGIY